MCTQHLVMAARSISLLNLCVNFSSTYIGRVKKHLNERAIKKYFGSNFTKDVINPKFLKSNLPTHKLPFERGKSRKAARKKM